MLLLSDSESTDAFSSLCTMTLEFSVQFSKEPRTET
jgi:hypothetical protein